jgi:hypothetical protein
MDITNKAIKVIEDGAIVKEFQIWNVWIEAVAQHYASGSKYLDVTHSIESAAWFALHRGEWKTERSILGPPGPPSPYDLPGDSRWLQYTRAVEPGYLYAFDVAEWDKAGATPPDLALIDLAGAPDPFRTPRMLAQAGCVIRTGEGGQHDLRPHRVAGTPLQIAWPMTGSEFVHRKVEEMFPSPALDPWYRRFLSVPMMPDMDTSGGVLLKRPLPVTLYRGDNEAYNAAVAATEVFLYPPLLHRVLESTGEKAEVSAEEWWRAISIRDATPIVLEAPLLRHFGPADSDLWNQELLLRDISDSVTTYFPSNKVTSGDVSLLNVLFQFSQLEEIFWERAERPSVTKQLVRGVWIARHDGEIFATLLYQDFPGTQVEAFGPMLIRLDPGKRRMVFEPRLSSMEWVDITSLPKLAKPIFIALSLLRALSPHWKAEAIPQIAASGKLESGVLENRYGVTVLADAARLIRVSDPAGLADWFVIRDRAGEPYVDAQTNTGVIVIKDARPFADIPFSVFHDAILASFAAEKT